MENTYPTDMITGFGGEISDKFFDIAEKVITSAKDIFSELIALFQ